MIVLGIDPGTARLGWGVIDTGKQNDVQKARCLAYGVVETDKSLTDSQRLLAIANGMEALLYEHKPELMVVEKLFYCNNQKTVMTVSQARGVILYVAERQGIALAEFTPQEIKMALTGYGRADKAQMQKMVQLILKLPEIPKPDDAADAIAIALIGAQTAPRPH